MSSASPEVQPAATSEEVSSGDERPDAASREVTPYVFGKPKQLSDEQAVFYREASAQLAAHVAATVREWVTGFTVEADPLTQLEPGAPMIDDESNFDVAPLVASMTPCGIIATENSLALALVAGTLGGGARSDVESRTLTSIETRVLDLILESILNATSRVFHLDQLSIARDRDNVLVVEDDDQATAQIGFNLRLQSQRGSGVMTLGLDTHALERFSDAVEHRVSGRRDAKVVQASPATAAALRPVPVHLSVSVGRAELSAREVVELREGDVIRTRVPVNSDLVAHAGDKDLFGVRVGQRGDHLVAEIVSAVTGEALR